MAIIKSYTDLEQSKKLAKILPLESADMKWYFWKSEIDAPKTPTFGYSKDAVESFKDTEEAVYLPCWSLAALLGVLPESYQLTSNKECKVQLMLIHHLEKDYYDNPVDACVAMIEKLHELKML